MPTTGFPALQTECFTAYVADNAALGVHCPGYNGIASLIPRGMGNNLFVPMYAGLNYETIWLTGLPPYPHHNRSLFEPRCEPMQIAEATADHVVLVQPETSHAHVSAKITFSVEEPHYLHQGIELVFHRRFCEKTVKCAFRSLWASYIHMPADRHVYVKLDPTSPVERDWAGVTKEDHATPEFLVRLLPEHPELTPAEHLAAMASQAPRPDGQVPQRQASPFLPPMVLPAILDGPLHAYYGFCRGDLLVLKMFRQPERFRFAYSPCGAGKEPAWNPAWDYVLALDDLKLETVYRWDLCLVVKPYAGRADIGQEILRYREVK
jgi:hypothetical protein